MVEHRFFTPALFPGMTLAQVIDRLAVDGWRVIQVFTDRHGNPAQWTDGFCVLVRRNQRDKSLRLDDQDEWVKLTADQINAIQRRRKQERRRKGD